MPETPRKDSDSASSEWGRLWRLIGEYTGLALTLPAAVVIGLVAGAALDEHFRTGRVFTLIGLFLGAAAGLTEIIRVAGRKDSGEK